MRHRDGVCAGQVPIGKSTLNAATTRSDDEAENFAIDATFYLGRHNACLAIFWLGTFDRIGLLPGGGGPSQTWLTVGRLYEACSILVAVCCSGGECVDGCLGP